MNFDMKFLVKIFFGDKLAITRKCSFKKTGLSRFGKAFLIYFGSVK